MSSEENHMNHWYRPVNPAATSRLGHIYHALFDFDGTLSVLRQGWEAVMISVMLESILGSSSPANRVDIEAEVTEYVDRSTGILTILQMEWLAQTVRRYGLVKQPLSAPEYKRIYLDRLMVSVRQRVARVASGAAAPANHMVAGSQEFIAGLSQRGVRLYLASGTDHADVVAEAKALGMLQYFTGGVFGALDNDENHAKERVIQRILDENHLSGAELLVVGDGPVEIREGTARSAVTLGVASDEVARSGWNEHKAARLTQAGVDLLVADFSHTTELLDLLLGPAKIAD